MSADEPAKLRVWVDGREVRPDRPAIAAIDQGFTHGWAVFETLRLVDGRAPFLERHAARLLAAAERLGRPTPDPRWRDELARAGAAVRWPHAAARVALTAGAGPAGPWSGPGAAPRRVLWLRPAPPPSPGPAVGRAVLGRPAFGLGPSGLKTHAYLGAMALDAAARRQGADVGLWQSEDGCVDAAATANLFIRIGDVLFTPPAGGAVRPGVTREVIREQLRIRGVLVSEQRLTRSALLAADEVFVTSSVRGVLALGEIDGVARPGPSPGPAACAAHEAWRSALL